MKKVHKLEQEIIKIAEGNNSVYQDNYIKFKQGKAAYLFKITNIIFYKDGAINYFKGNLLALNGTPYYRNNYILTLSGLGDNWKFISKKEFEKLLTKGLDLIKKNFYD